ncbi:GNAT family N-acetyltransferase [Albimonas sp. CAU 1670]|uniref:GNAT family N-acetyltransferase n=1 Tax=Albimonas sp. CAU 1670 TaxID=3032599 RepID=UPI0023D99FB7|nr:GNAT family N-acetyltransferase [Albimonas sp. CAU 1670]MDF2232040.1 GNAT family N-acetyltransferase [Albimonas sp. CAU 1670]
MTLAEPSPAVDVRLVPVDSPEALELIAGSEEELASIYPPEVRFAFSPRQLIDAQVHFVVARVDGVPAACGGFAPLAGYGELKRMFTRKDFRGRRLAGAILEALEAEARARGLPLMRLETGEASPEAIRAYERAGYARRGPFGDYEENGSSVFMEKRLA